MRRQGELRSPRTRSRKRDPGRAYKPGLSSPLAVSAQALTSGHQTKNGQHKVPAIYAFSSTVQEGGLIAYGVDSTDLFRRAAPYVDRILRGARPADLPVQQPTLFELAVNLKTAKALGLTVPHSILVRADLVIE